jgi:NADPH-dependent 2,4-dienoyl-CoA reductase/sulfur reductase-like enzyme
MMPGLLDNATGGAAAIIDRPDPGSDKPPDQRPAGQSLHRIVVVGGGAAGLELVTRLGRRRGRRGEAEITLVDCARTPFVEADAP